MKGIFKRLSLLFMFLILAVIVFIIIVPWMFIGTTLFVLRWVLTGNVKGCMFYILGGLAVPTICFLYICVRLNIINDITVEDTLLKELKEQYNSF